MFLIGELAPAGVYDRRIYGAQALILMLGLHARNFSILSSLVLPYLDLLFYLLFLFAISAGPAAIGPHTYTHTYLPSQISPGDQRKKENKGKDNPSCTVSDDPGRSPAVIPMEYK